jgi:hypothetical protein
MGSEKEIEPCSGYSSSSFIVQMCGIEEAITREAMHVKAADATNSAGIANFKDG